MSSKRVRFITLAGTVFAVLVIAVSLLLSRISLETRQMNLPETTSGVSDPPGAQSGSLATDGGRVRVEVTTDTVQEVIASLQRPTQYSRQLVVISYYADGSAEYDIDVAVLDAARSVEIHGGGQNKNIIIVGRTLYVWNDGDDDYYISEPDTSENNMKLSDMYQMLLTYEDVLDVEPSDITFADYENYNGEMCIVVRYRAGKLQYLTTCYISAKTGLLVGAEQYDGTTKVYEMSALGYTTDVDAARFDLPDGTTAISGD